MQYDVIIVGGGPAGLAAALTLGRARARVLLADSGPRRNAAAEKIYNFVTRDGTPPDEFRQVARAQLTAYPNVEVRDAPVTKIRGASGAFHVEVDGEGLEASRILLCTGMVDESLPLPGFEDLWGHHIVQCPYCHGWEVRDSRWGFLVLPDQEDHVESFGALLQQWSPEVTIFASEGVVLSARAREGLEHIGVTIARAPAASVVARGNALHAVALTNGDQVPCEVLFAHPPQHQVPLVQALRLSLDQAGYVVVDATSHETSTAGIHAAGDLTQRSQAAILSAAAGTRAAAAINLSLAQGSTHPDKDIGAVR